MEAACIRIRVRRPEVGGAPHAFSGAGALNAPPGRYFFFTRSVLSAGAS
jgi:hypothetical protein